MKLARFLLAGAVTAASMGILWVGLAIGPDVCIAGQPTPCKDTEHPQEPPCDMKSCKRMDGTGSVCNHYCTKGKGCCFCKQDQCGTTRPPSGDEN